LHLSKKDQEISKTVIKEIVARLKFMLDVGLDYLTLDRRANTLSGGEAQRIRLASQLGSGLVGALYVLDEPTIGLHQRDNERLIKTLLNLRDLGNTILLLSTTKTRSTRAIILSTSAPALGFMAAKSLLQVSSTNS
jgi:excinuclease ABC subunit A